MPNDRLMLEVEDVDVSLPVPDEEAERFVRAATYPIQWSAAETKLRWRDEDEAAGTIGVQW